MTSVVISGPRGGVPLVFLHDASSNLAMWKPQLDILSAEFRCIAIDLPGHGALQGSDFTLEGAVAEVADVLRHDAGGRGVLVGLSVGGYVGIATAAHHPELVAGLVASGVGSHSATPRVSRIQGRLLPIFGFLLKRPAAKALRRIAPAETAAAIRERGLSWRGAGDAMRDLAGRNMNALLRRYDGPVLVLLGERDAPNIDGAPQLVAGVPNAEIEILPDAGHSCSLSQPEDFSLAVRDFVRRTQAPPV
ncbi:MAG: alpha/beta fold hydrolase [Acidimicrobiia bacterium]|nr:alpha/beta fold hydrolase [Acidimicrobiia bacterium]